MDDACSHQTIYATRVAPIMGLAIEYQLYKPKLLVLAISNVNENNEIFKIVLKRCI